MASMAPSSEPLEILQLEDDPVDADLVASILREDGLECRITRVDSRAAFEEAIGARRFDLILADYQLPAFDGVSAHTRAREVAPETPFIFVSGTIGEELAIERLKAGAVDYVLKERLHRLPSSVRRGLREAREHADKERAERALRDLNRDLDAQVAERTAELAAANARLAERERELRDSEARLSAILEHSPVAICLKDLDGRYRMANRRYLAIMRRSRDDVVGRFAAEFAGARLAAIYQEHDRLVIERGEAMEFEEPVVVDDAVRIFVSSKFLLHHADGRPYALCSIGVDITERRRAEEEARLAAREALQANAAKNEFLSRMSHDLRTPLNAILGFGQVLERAGLAPEHADGIREILMAGRHLLDLINEVLDISRIESGHLSLSPEPVPVHEIVRDAVGIIRPIADRAGIAVSLAESGAACHVRADRQRLRQILINLLSNAVKYNRPGGRVTVSVLRSGTDRLRIGVTDTGAGLTAAQVAQLFRPFERLGAEQRGIEGTGLGLALSRGLAEAMDGTLGVESVPGQGTTFWVELTVVPAPSAAPIAATAASELPARDPKKVSGTIVYVEDNSSNVRLIERVLQSRPAVTLLVAPTAAAGVGLVRTRRPDLVFLDLHLPDATGEEVLGQLVNDPATRDVPVVILSADATPRQIEHLTARGAAGYLTKPLDIRAVLHTVDRHLGSADVTS
jgi:PAS domain S-box-containing protein